MSKYKRTVVGSVIKSKDSNRPDYVKFKTSVSFKEGDTVSLETKKFQLESLNAAVQSNKLTEEMAEKIRERIEKMPEWVRGDLVKLDRNAG